MTKTYGFDTASDVRNDSGVMRRPLASSQPGVPRKPWRTPIWLAVMYALCGYLGAVRAAPPAPSGPHPRIFLSPAVKTRLAAQASQEKSAAAGAIARCQRFIDKPEAADKSGYQGDNWGYGASSCGLAYQVTGDANYAAPGVKLWRALLEDVTALGDKKACVAGATKEQAIASIRRDTGYAIRFVGPHTALAYDWLHDAPGATEALRKQTRDCFRFWVDHYTQDGYLSTQPGANYNAGFVLAKTLIAVAQAGEAGSDGDRIWTEAVDEVFGKTILANGLAQDNGGVPRPYKHGVLVGGDWAEGWQYGPLSVIGYAAAARVLMDSGVDLAPIRAWAGDLALRQVYALTPDRKQIYPGGDVGSAKVMLDPNRGPFLATFIGAGPDEAAAYALSMLQTLFPAQDDDSFWEAIARGLLDTEKLTPQDPLGGKLPPWYLARGTRNVFMRSDWSTGATYAVFQAAPRVVNDHQHFNASNFVLVRGGDPLIVDPTTYASRSSLGGNAISVETDAVKGDYKPSQTPWSTADLTFVRGTASGVVAARADIHEAFKMRDAQSDVPLARRDFTFLPEGEIVLLDRVTTPGPGYKALLRFRAPMALSPSTSGPLVVTGTQGTSALAIHAVHLKPEVQPAVKMYAKGECEGPFGACRAARFDVWEYNWEAAGPDVLAVHVLDALGQAETPAEVAPLSAPAIDAGGANTAVVGASIFRQGKHTFVVGAADPGRQGPFSYEIPAKNPSRHVVFDAPLDADKTAVSVTAMGDRCRIDVAAAGTLVLPGRPAIFTLTTAAEGCKVSEDENVPMGSVSPGSDGYKPPKSGPGTGGRPAMDGNAGDAGGCSCHLGTRNPTDTPQAPAAWFLAAGVGLMLTRARRTRR